MGGRLSEHVRTAHLFGLPQVGRLVGQPQSADVNTTSTEQCHYSSPISPAGSLFHGSDGYAEVEVHAFSLNKFNHESEAPSCIELWPGNSSRDGAGGAECTFSPSLSANQIPNISGRGLTHKRKDAPDSPEGNLAINPSLKATNFDCTRWAKRPRLSAILGVSDTPPMGELNRTPSVRAAQQRVHGPAFRGGILYTPPAVAAGSGQGPINGSPITAAARNYCFKDSGDKYTAIQKPKLAYTSEHHTQFPPQSLSRSPINQPNYPSHAQVSLGKRSRTAHTPAPQAKKRISRASPTPTSGSSEIHSSSPFTTPIHRQAALSPVPKGELGFRTAKRVPPTGMYEPSITTPSRVQIPGVPVVAPVGTLIATSATTPTITPSTSRTVTGSLPSRNLQPPQFKYAPTPPPTKIYTPHELSEIALARRGAKRDVAGPVNVTYICPSQLMLRPMPPPPLPSRIQETLATPKEQATIVELGIQVNPIIANQTSWPPEAHTHTTNSQLPQVIPSNQLPSSALEDFEATLTNLHSMAPTHDIGFALWEAHSREYYRENPPDPDPLELPLRNSTNAFLGYSFHKPGVNKVTPVVPRIGNLFDPQPKHNPNKRVMEDADEFEIPPPAAKRAKID